MSKTNLPSGFLKDLADAGITLPDEIIAEMTGMGAVAGYEVPLGAIPQSKKRRKKKKDGRIKE